MPDNPLAVVGFIVVVMLIVGLLLTWEMRRTDRKSAQINAKAAEAAEQKQGAWKSQPLPVVVDNPPTLTTYDPKPGRPIRDCSCHNRPLAVGRPAMLWPIPDEPGKDKGRMYVFCEETVVEMKQGVEASGDHA